MQRRDESFEISKGALIVLSKFPTSLTDLKRNFKEDIWAPRLVVATPTPEKPFIIRSSGIEQKGTPYYIKHENGVGVWYGDVEIRKTLNVFGYAFLPGEIRSEFEFKGSIIDVLKNSFIPDEKDPNQERLDINIISGMDTLGYTDNASFRANVDLTDLGNTVYNLLFSPSLSYFGYDCYHSGEIGLPSRMEGRMEISIDQGKKAANAIMSDLETKIKLN